MFRTFLVIAVWVALWSPIVHAQESDEELAKAAANPLADLISIPLQNNTDYNLGPFDRARNVLNIQPVAPFAGGRLLTRTIIPILWLPDLTSSSGMAATGLGDITLTAFYAPPGSGDVTWGVGPVIDLPTGGASRGSEKWNIGPSVVVLTAPGSWTLGVLANNVWSVAGESARPDVNRGSLQYFIVYTLEGGWYVNSAPIITVNWEAASGEEWTVPFGAGAGKIMRVGKVPVNLQAGAYVNAVKPSIGPDWQMRLQAQLLLPKSLFTGG